jgi:hypothetical protein
MGEDRRLETITPAAPGPYSWRNVMRVEFRNFTELGSGNPVAVNPSLVRCIKPADSEGHALIEFGDDHVVAVTADVAGAASTLTVGQD